MELSILIGFSLVVMGTVYQRYCSDRRKTVAGAGGVAPGTLEADTAGTVWLSQGLNTIPEGEAVEWVRGQIVEVDKDASATVFAANGLVGYDSTNKVAVASGTGDFNIGRARKASSASDETVYVELFVVHPATS